MFDPKRPPTPQGAGQQPTTTSHKVGLIDSDKASHRAAAGQGTGEREKPTNHQARLHDAFFLFVQYIHIKCSTVYLHDNYY